MNNSRTTGEQNKVCRTTMYVQAAQAQHTKGVRRFLVAQTGLDNACYAVGAVFRPSFPHPSVPAHRFPSHQHEPRLTKVKQNPSPRCTQSEIPRERSAQLSGSVGDSRFSFLCVVFPSSHFIPMRCSRDWKAGSWRRLSQTGSTLR